MTVRIGLDMDNVIIDNNVLWKAYYDLNFAAHSHKELHCGIPPTWDYVSELCSICFKQVVHNPYILAQSLPMYGAIKGVRQLSHLIDSNGEEVELWLVSHRAPELTLVATNVIRRFGILSCFAHMDWSWGNKLDTCLKDRISILVDDGPKNILALKGSPVTPIIYDWPYNRHIEGLRAHNWEEVVSICQDLVSSKVCV